MSVRELAEGVKESARHLATSSKQKVKAAAEKREKIFSGKKEHGNVCDGRLMKTSPRRVY